MSAFTVSSWADSAFAYGHHLLGEGIGLRHLCDWAVFADSLKEKEFRSLFETKLKSIGLWKFACILSQVCYKYLHCHNLSWLEGRYADDRAPRTLDISGAI